MKTHPLLMLLTGVLCGSLTLQGCGFFDTGDDGPVPYSSYLYPLTKGDSLYCDAVATAYRSFYRAEDDLLIVERRSYDSSATCSWYAYARHSAQDPYADGVDTVFYEFNDTCFPPDSNSYVIQVAQMPRRDSVVIVSGEWDTVLVFDSSLQAYPCQLPW